jgi:hypothetical protein
MTYKKTRNIRELDLQRANEHSIFQDYLAVMNERDFLFTASVIFTSHS